MTDKMSLIAALVALVVIVGVYFSKVPATEQYIQNAGKMSAVTQQQYSAEYLYKNSTAAAPTAAADTTAQQP